MKLYNNEIQTPLYLQKHGKAHEIIMMLLTFIIMPIASILIITLTCQSVGLRVVQTTASMLMWYNGKFASVWIWGALNLGLYVYLLKLNLDSQRYSKPVRIAFYVFFGVTCALLVGGMSIPLPPEYQENIILHKTHNNLVTIGFVFLIFEMLVFCVTTYWRNVKQAVIMTGFMCFFLITGIFAIPQVNAPDAHTFVTVATQMYILAMMHVMFALNYCLAKILPARFDLKESDLH